MNIKDLKDTYLSYNSFRDHESKRIDARIELRKKQIERLEKKSRKNWNEHRHWTTHYLIPVMEELRKSYPDIEWEDDDFQTFGLLARVPIFGKYNGETILIEFTVSSNILYIATGNRIKKHSENSIADLNGFGKERIEVTCMNDIYKIINNQKSC